MSRDDGIEKGAWVAHLVLAETVSALDAVYERSLSQLATAIELLLKHETLTTQREDVVAAALTNFRKRSAPGFSDCLVLEIARKSGHLPLGRFDKRLEKLSSAHGL